MIRGRRMGATRRALLGSAGRPALLVTGALGVSAIVACAGSEAPPAPAAPQVTLRLHGGSAGAEGDYWPQTDFNAALTRELAPVWTGGLGARDGAEAARRAGQDVLDRAAS